MLLRPTRPKEVRRAVTPHVLAGYMIDPPVSVPKANGTNPAEVAAAGPAKQQHGWKYSGFKDLGFRV